MEKGLVSELPLGQAEGQKLEFKSAAVLKDLGKVGRAVVALLNSGGGVLWLGIEEEQSVAVRATPVLEPARERQRVLDSLVDRVEPRLRPGEVQVDLVAGSVLKVTVRAHRGRGPFCLTSGDGRVFLARNGARNRPMTYEELFSKPDRSQEPWYATLDGLRPRGADSLLWMAVLPHPEVELDLGRVEPLLLDPIRTGNRRDGWSFATEMGDVRRKKGRLTREGENWGLEVHRSGLITLRLSLSHLYHKGPPGMLWPLALLEYPTSLFRLARHVYEGHEVEEVAVDLALLQVAGWTLRPYAVDSLRFQLGGAPPYSDEPDLVWARPIIYRWDELRESPDRCAYRWIRLVYEAFGYTEQQIPVEFHPERGLQIARR